MNNKFLVVLGFLVILSGCAGSIDRKEISQNVTHIYGQDINLILPEQSGNIDAPKNIQYITHMMAWINISSD